MYYVEFKKIKSLGLIIVLFFTFSLLIISVKAEDELVLLPDDEQTVGNDFSDDSSYSTTIVKRKSKFKKEPFLRDKVFMPTNGSLTFNRLLTRVSLIIFALLGFLILIKLFMSRDQFGKPGSLLDEIAQKFTGNFSSSQGMKLKQTLILTPGQNIYLIEIDGKRLLIGATQQGGVQFLADMTQSTLKNEKLDFKQIEEQPMAMPEIMMSSDLKGRPARYMNGNGAENPFTVKEALTAKELPNEIKQTLVNQNGKFKRRTNFRQSLFNENMNGAEDLIRSR